MTTFNKNQFTVLGKANTSKTAQAEQGTKSNQKNSKNSKSTKASNVAVVNVFELVDVIDSVTEIDQKDLPHIKVSLKGEFINCGNVTYANKVYNHVKAHYRRKGFKVGLLEQYLMIVPRVHKEFDVPDFSAYQLPDFKKEFAHSLLGKKQELGGHVVANSPSGFEQQLAEMSEKNNSKKLIFIIGALLTCVGGILGFIANMSNQNK